MRGLVAGNCGRDHDAGLEVHGIGMGVSGRTCGWRALPDLQGFEALQRKFSVHAARKAGFVCAVAMNEIRRKSRIS